MYKGKRVSKPAAGGGKKPSKLVIILCSCALVLLILIIVMLLLLPKNKPEENTPENTTTAPTTEPTTAVTTAPTEETTEPTVETQPVMLENMAALYEENPDVVGWVKIEGTKLDYPVMYTPDDEEKYIRADFKGKFSVAGLPFIDADCSVEPQSDNLIIYGHNMNNGTAFRAMMGYDTIDFWRKHPTFTYSTLYEEKTYEVLAAFYDRVYLKSENLFKFYQFVDAEDEADFDAAVQQFKKKSLYDTGVTAEYGDHLITLVTCAYHVDNGRFVVVGREVTAD